MAKVTAPWAQVWLAEEGTGTGGGPIEGTTLRVEPSLSTVPGLGDCEMTDPAATVIEVTPCSRCKVK